MLLTSQAHIAVPQLARTLFPGLAIAAILAMAARFVSGQYGGPQILYALLFGMALNFLAAEATARPGIAFASKVVLRLGVALLGMRIGLADIAGLGLGTVLLVLAGVTSTIALGLLLAPRFGLTREQGVLTGGATAICGASAAMAIAAILPRSKVNERDTIFTVAAVTALSTIAMVAYPLLTAILELSDMRAGILLGATIHDVAQVVGAGYMISETAADSATVTKLMRVAMLVPVCLAIAAWLSLAARSQAGTRRRVSLTLPWFLVAFVIFACANSAGFVPDGVVLLASDASRWCLVTAIAAIGIKTSVGELRPVGWRAIALVFAETLFLLGLVVTVMTLQS